MKTNTVIDPNSPQSSLEVNFTEMFKFNNILIGLMLLISDFFKDRPLLKYNIILMGVFLTTILISLLNGYPEFFGRWEYVIRIFFAFPIIYFILATLIPSSIQMFRSEYDEKINNLEEIYDEEIAILVFFLIYFFILVCMAILAYKMMLGMHLLLWFGWLSIHIFKQK